jgi:hypothetical protein
MNLGLGFGKWEVANVLQLKPQVEQIYPDVGVVFL